MSRRSSRAGTHDECGSDHPGRASSRSACDRIGERFRSEMIAIGSLLVLVVCPSPESRRWYSSPPASLERRHAVRDPSSPNRAVRCDARSGRDGPSAALKIGDRGHRTIAFEPRYDARRTAGCRSEQLAFCPFQVFDWVRSHWTLPTQTLLEHFGQAFSEARSPFRATNSLR